MLTFQLLLLLLFLLTLDAGTKSSQAAASEVETPVKSWLHNAETGMVRGAEEPEGACLLGRRLAGLPNKLCMNP